MIMNPNSIEEMKNMLLNQHLHVSKVAEKFGITRQRIWQICKKHGIIIHRPVALICVYCGEIYNVGRSRVRYGSKYCSDVCYYSHRRDSSNFKEHRQGRRKARKIIALHLNKELPEGSVVHHIDGNQDNNDISNLMLFVSQSDHITYHHNIRRLDRST